MLLIFLEEISSKHYSLIDKYIECYYDIRNIYTYLLKSQFTQVPIVTVSKCVGMRVSTGAVCR